MTIIMPVTIRDAIRWLGVMALCCCYAPAHGGSPQPDVFNRGDTLVIGYVTDNPRNVYNRLQPIAEYVVARLGDIGISKFGVRMVKTHEEMIDLLSAGEVDWVTESAFGAARFMVEAGAEPILVRRNGGQSETASLVFVRRDSGIRNLEDLVDSTILFEDPSSTSTYYIPLMELVDRGLKPRLLGGPRDVPDAGHVGYLFSHGVQNSSAWVYQGIAQAAAVSDEDWHRAERIPARHMREYRVIFRSQPYPRAVELVSGHVDRVLKQRLSAVLLASHGDKTATEPLSRYLSATDYLPLSPAHMQLLARIGRQYGPAGGGP